MRCSAPILALLVAALFCVPRLVGCPFCTPGTTLTQEVSSASLIIFGTPKNARLDLNQFAQGATDLEIEAVIKSHDVLGDKKALTIPRYMPQDEKQPVKYLIFCDVYKGQIDPYRGMPVRADSKIVPYLKGALALKDKDLASRLKFFFDYLDDSDLEISNDAYLEFGNADYKDIRPIAEKFSADKLVRWLKDPGTPTSRLGLYGLLLGHCGNASHLAVLREMADDPQRRLAGGLDGILAGLTLLNPADGWAMISKILNDSQGDFLCRYAALKTARFIWEFRPDVVARDKIAETVTGILSQPDIADMAVEDLGKWGHWKGADRVLGLLKLPSHDLLLVRRAVLRYALRCPANQSPAAAAFVAEQRAKNKKWVEEVESLLNSESAPAVSGK